MGDRDLLVAIGIWYANTKTHYARETALFSTCARDHYSPIHLCLRARSLDTTESTESAIA